LSEWVRLPTSPAACRALRHRLRRKTNLWSLAGAALNRLGLHELDFAGEGVTPDNDREQKQQVAKAAAGLEGKQTEVAVAQAWRPVRDLENSAKRAHAHGQQLRDLDYTLIGNIAGSLVGTIVGERERVRGPDAEGFNDVEHVAQAALETACPCAT